MKFNITNEGRFTPTWKENDKSDEPIEVFYRRLTGNDMTRTMKFAGTEMAYDMMEICKRCIKDIKNLVVNDIEITTGEELINQAGFHGLCLQIATHIINDSTVTVDLEKKNKDSTSLAK